MTEQLWRNANPLREYRFERGMSQFTAATMLGVHSQSVQGWEFGRAVPNKEHMEAIAKLMVTTRTLLTVRWSRWLEQRP